MNKNDIDDAIRSIVKKIKEAQGTKGPAGIIKFDFSGKEVYTVSKVIQELLVKKGYIAYVFMDFSKDVTVERLYIDLNRYRSPKKDLDPTTIV